MSKFYLGQYRLVNFKDLYAIAPDLADLVVDYGSTITVHDVNPLGSVLLWQGNHSFSTRMILGSWVKFFIPIENVAEVIDFRPAPPLESANITPVIGYEFEHMYPVPVKQRKPLDDPRRAFYIDVGDCNPIKAKEHVTNIMSSVQRSSMQLGACA